MRDAMATALLVLGPTELARSVREELGIAAYFLIRNKTGIDGSDLHLNFDLLEKRDEHRFFYTMC